METRTSDEPFYSNLQRVIEAKMPTSAPVQHVTGLIRSHQIHPEEMQYSGLPEFLAGKQPGDKVAKGDVLDTLKRNAPRVNLLHDERNKYAAYATPGGHNYHERQLQLQYGDQGPYEGEHDPYTGGHYSSPNVIAHTRGKLFGGTPDHPSTLYHLDELQSDWHQKGRNDGYQSEKYRRLKGIADHINRTLDQFGGNGSLDNLVLRDSIHSHFAQDYDAEHSKATIDKAGVPQHILDDLHSHWPDIQAHHLLSLENGFQDNGEGESGMPPDGPFKNNWHELGLKLALHDAVRAGADGLTFNPGEDQSKRYKESRYYSYDPEERCLSHHDPDTQEVTEDHPVPPESLADELDDPALAHRLLTNPYEVMGQHSKSKQDLYGAIEGGVRHGIIGNKLNRYLKRFGSQVGVTTLPNQHGDEPTWEQFSPQPSQDHEGWHEAWDPEDQSFSPHRSQEEADVVAGERYRTAHYKWTLAEHHPTQVFHVPITEALRKHVLSGQPLWGDVDASLRKSILWITATKRWLRKSLVGAHWRTNPATGVKTYVSQYTDSRFHTFKPPIQPRFDQPQPEPVPQGQEPDDQQDQQAQQDQQDQQAPDPDTAPSPAGEGKPAASGPQDSTTDPAFPGWFGASKVAKPDGTPLPVWPLLDSHQADAGSSDPHHDTPLGHGYYFSTSRRDADETATAGDQHGVPVQYRVPVLDEAHQAAAEHGVMPPGPEAARQFAQHGDLRILQPNTLHPMYQHLEAVRDAAVAGEARPCYLSIQRPVDTGQRMKPTELASVMANNPPLVAATRSAVESRTGSPDWDHARAADLINGMTALGHDHDTARVLQSMGYDGITHRSGGQVVHVAFSPEQIKPQDQVQGPAQQDLQKAITTQGGGDLYHSTLAQTLQSKMPARATVDTVRGIANYPQGSVPSEEHYYTGLHNFLDQHPAGQPVDKAALLQHLKTQTPDLRVQHRTEGDAGFSKVLQPGGVEVREHLVLLPTHGYDDNGNPNRAYTPFEGHWGRSEPVVAHLRTTTRRIIDGGKALHIDEAQSDQHQAGRVHGYALPSDYIATLPDVKDAERRSDDAAAFHMGLSSAAMSGSGFDLDQDLDKTDWSRVDAARDASAAALDHYHSTVSGHNGEVPDAPFKKEWMGLLIKHALHLAAKSGARHLTVTTGHDQAGPTKASLYGSPEYRWHKTPRGYMVRLKPQAGGGMMSSGGISLEELANQDGRNTPRQEEIKSLPHLHAFVQGYGEGEKTQRAKLAEALWGKMQESDTGTHYPRLAGMAAYYGDIDPLSGTSTPGQVTRWLQQAGKRHGATIETLATPSPHGRYHIQHNGVWGQGFGTQEEARDHAHERNLDGWSTEPVRLAHGITMTPGLVDQSMRSQPLWGMAPSALQKGIVALIG